MQLSEKGKARDLYLPRAGEEGRARPAALAGVSAATTALRGRCSRCRRSGHSPVSTRIYRAPVVSQPMSA